MDVLSENRVSELLDSALYAHVAVVSRGDPYVTATSFVRLGDSLYLRSFPGERLDALRAHPRASLSVVEFDEASGTWESVVVKGDVTFIDDSRLAQDVVSAFFEKYRRYEDALSGGAVQPPLGQAEIIGVSMEQVSGRSSGKWLEPPVRPGRL